VAVSEIPELWKLGGNRQLENHQKFTDELLTLPLDGAGELSSLRAMDSVGELVSNRWMASLTDGYSGPD